MRSSDPAIPWLLSSADPSVRHITLTEICGASPRSAQASALRRAIPKGPRIRALLRGQRADGGFGVHPYAKWNGAHWRLVSLIELGIPPGHPPALRAVEQVLRWLHGGAHRSRIVAVNGLVRRCASQEGNALRVGSRLGLGSDPRVHALAEDLVRWQWPDGGWNCDQRPRARHSSFHESVIPLWALAEFRQATGDRSVDQAIDRAAEFLLRHRLFRSERDGSVITDRRVKGGKRAAAVSPFLWLRYPPYWHYDILTALRVMAQLGRLGDRRVQEALDIIEGKRGPDGLWKSEGRWWRPPGSRGSGVEVVDWARPRPEEMITLNAMRVLGAAGRVRGKR